MTAEEFEYFWSQQGFCYRLGEFHDMMRGAGLRLPFNNVESNARIMLYDFLVRGLGGKRPEDHGGARVLWWQKKRSEESKVYDRRPGSREEESG